MNAQNLMNAFQMIDTELIEDAEEQRISGQNQRDRKQIFLRVTAGLTAAAACCGLVFLGMKHMPDGLTSLSTPANSQVDFEEIGAHTFELQEAHCTLSFDPPVISGGCFFYCYDVSVQNLQDITVKMLTQTSFDAVGEQDGTLRDYNNYAMDAVALRFTPMNLCVKCGDETVMIRDFNTAFISLDDSEHIYLMCGASDAFWRLEYDGTGALASALHNAVNEAAYAGLQERFWWNIPEAIADNIKERFHW